jgi:hypothetical protein
MKNTKNAQRYWYERNRAQVLERSKARRKTLAYKSWQKRYNHDPATWAKRACYQLKHKARELGIVFDLVPADLTIPAFCPFTLLPFDFGPKSGKPRPQSPSVDRIRPDRGYVRGNVRVIALQANVAKSDITDPAIFERLAADAHVWALVS